MELPPLKRPSFPRSIVLRGALPLPAQGGRSLCVMPAPRALLATSLFDGRLPLLANPADARPRSVELPCASQVRPFELPRGELLLIAPRLALPSAFVRMFEFGLSSDSSRCREVIAPPFCGDWLKRPELIGMEFCGRLPLFSKLRPLFPGRSVPGRIVPALNERVGMLEAPRAGVFRATTARF